jgi:outer membrane protein assembly factor BamD (BamD/ComL family)
MANEQERLKKAQQLLQNKDYAAARTLLETISSNPTAKKWLAQLDKISQEKPVISQSSLNEQFATASNLIKQQRYDDARALLKKIDTNPKAQQWLWRNDLDLS